jgi:hypothetical protein
VRSPDGFVAELHAASGQFVKSWRFGSQSWDLAAAITSDNAGGVLVAGYVNHTNGSLTFTSDFPDGSTHTSTSTDIAVIRFSVSAPAPAAVLTRANAAAPAATQQRQATLLASSRLRNPSATDQTSAATDRVMRLYANRRALPLEDR